MAIEKYFLYEKWSNLEESVCSKHCMHASLKI